MQPPSVWCEIMPTHISCVLKRRLSSVQCDCVSNCFNGICLDKSTTDKALCWLKNSSGRVIAAHCQSVSYLSLHHTRLCEVSHVFLNGLSLGLMPYSLACRFVFPSDKVCTIPPVIMRVNWVNVGLPFTTSLCTVCQKDHLNPTQENFPLGIHRRPGKRRKTDIFCIIRTDLDLGATDEQKAVQSVWMQCLILEKMAQRF